MAISYIGMMTSMNNFSALSINMDTIITGIIADDNEKSPLHRQTQQKFTSTINCTYWDVWFANNGGCMPCLYWHSSTFLKRIFTNLPNLP